MKAVLASLLLVCVAAVSLGQITITAADFSSQLTLGNRLINRADTLTTTANIGAPGTTANTWTFSALNTHLFDTLRSVDPSTTPFISQFPGSTHALQTSITIQGITATVFQYLKLQTNLLNPGAMGSGEVFPGVTGTLRIRNIPDATVFQFPMTLNTTWTSTYAESTIIALPPPFPPQVSIINYSETHTVDAHGNLTLPGTVGTFQALRIRNDVRSSTGSGRSISYQFIARNGASVSVAAADTLQPNTGTITIDRSTTWSGQIQTDVRISDALPDDFALRQNYPNPFNPSTTIQYQVARTEFVSIQLYNMLGQTIATLVNEVRSPGTYALNWSAEGIPSGVYFYKLQAGAFSATRRMMVVK